MIIDILKNEKKLTINESYYDKINEWISMWKGKASYLNENWYDNVNMKTRKRYSLKMPKKVAEDWASIFSENNQVTYDGATEKQEVEIGEFLAKTNFWGNINEQLELGFALGTVAALIRATLSNQDGRDNIDKISLDYVTANNIYPLTIENGNITECIFASEKLIDGKKYALVETHKLNNQNNYEITNELYMLDNSNGVNDYIKVAPEQFGIVSNYTSSVKLFHIFKPNLLNNIDNARGLGLSIYHNAYDNFIAVDFAFDIFASDLKLGKKMMFLSEEMLKIDENGRPITPQEANQDLFRWVQTNEEKGDLIHEFNPTLRVQEDEMAVQKQLDYLSFKVGFGTKHYQFNAGSIVTATQYVGDKQEMLKYVKKHFNNYKVFTEGILNAMLELIGMSNVKAIIPFEDTIIMDDEAMKANDLMLVNSGIMNKWEYRVKWFNETEEEAKNNAPTDNFVSSGDIF